MGYGRNIPKRMLEKGGTNSEVSKRGILRKERGSAKRRKFQKEGGKPNEEKNGQKKGKESTSKNRRGAEGDYAEGSVDQKTILVLG